MKKTQAQTVKQNTNAIRNPKSLTTTPTTIFLGFAYTRCWENMTHILSHGGLMVIGHGGIRKNITSVLKQIQIFGGQIQSYINQMWVMFISNFTKKLDNFSHLQLPKSESFLAAPASSALVAPSKTLRRLPHRYRRVGNRRCQRHPRRRPPGSFSHKRGIRFIHINGHDVWCWDWDFVSDFLGRGILVFAFCYIFWSLL